jgi:hypothetical protein
VRQYYLTQQINLPSWHDAQLESMPPLLQPQQRQAQKLLQ